MSYYNTVITCVYSRNIYFVRSAGAEMVSDNSSENVFRVSSNTPTKELGQAIVRTIEGGKTVVVRAVGAGAVSQAIKGIAVAEGYAARQTMRLKSNFGFFTTSMPDKPGEVSGILMRITQD